MSPIMKRSKYIYMSGMILSLCLASCGNDDPIEGPKDQETPISISTTIFTQARPTLEFEEGNVMNLYAKTYGSAAAPDKVEGVKAIQQGGNWKIEPEVMISESEKLFIYAYAPYTEGLNTTDAIPVDISLQQDILYSGAFVPVSYRTNRAKLTMKHALSLVSFNVSAQGYSGNGELQRLSIVGDNVYTSGVMSIDKGKIIGKGQEVYEATVSKVVTADGWENDLPRMWQIPFSTKAAEVYLNATIDGKTYKTTFPEVEMKSGFQYIFRMVLTDYGLEFIPNQTQTISLSVESDTPEQLEGYGVLHITHSAPSFMAPEMTGDNVFGSVKWGDEGTTTYRVGEEHAYAEEGSKEVSIETWNSNGFKLKNLIGVEAIDLTQY